MASPASKKRAAQYLGELLGDLMPQEGEKNDDRNENSQQVQRWDGSVVLGFQAEPIDPPLYSRLYFTTWRKSCQPSKPSPQMPLSSERNRRPSCCCQPQAGSRRFDISESRYPEPGRTMAAPDQRSWPFQPRMRGRRMRRWQPSPGKCSSWCSPIVVRPVSDLETNRVGGQWFLRKRICFRRAH